MGSPFIEDFIAGLCAYFLDEKVSQSYEMA